MTYLFAFFFYCFVYFCQLHYLHCSEFGTVIIIIIQGELNFSYIFLISLWLLGEIWTSDLYFMRCGTCCLCHPLVIEHIYVWLCVCACVCINIQQTLELYK